MIDSKLSLALVRLLRSTVCPMCGERKDPGQCFCKTHYFSLTKRQRNQLYTPLDSVTGEFEQYYLEAMRYLKARGHARKLSEWPAEAQRLVESTGIMAVLIEMKKTEARS